MSSYTTHQPRRDDFLERPVQLVPYDIVFDTRNRDKCTWPDTNDYELQFPLENLKNVRSLELLQMQVPNTTPPLFYLQCSSADCTCAPQVSKPRSSTTLYSSKIRSSGPGSVINTTNCGKATTCGCCSSDSCTMTVCPQTIRQAEWWFNEGYPIAPGRDSFCVTIPPAVASQKSGSQRQVTVVLPRTHQIWDSLLWFNERLYIRTVQEHRLVIGSLLMFTVHDVSTLPEPFLSVMTRNVWKVISVVDLTTVQITQCQPKVICTTTECISAVMNPDDDPQKDGQCEPQPETFGKANREIIHICGTVTVLPSSSPCEFAHLAEQRLIDTLCACGIPSNLLQARIFYCHPIYRIELKVNEALLKHNKSMTNSVPEDIRTFLISPLEVIRMRVPLLYGGASVLAMQVQNAMSPIVIHAKHENNILVIVPACQEDEIEVVIPSGCYTPERLAAQIADQINQYSTNDCVSGTWDPCTGRYTFCSICRPMSFLWTKSPALANLLGFALCDLMDERKITSSFVTHPFPCPTDVSNANSLCGCPPLHSVHHYCVTVDGPSNTATIKQSGAVTFQIKSYQRVVNECDTFPSHVLRLILDRPHCFEPCDTVQLSPCVPDGCPPEMLPFTFGLYGVVCSRPIVDCDDDPFTILSLGYMCDIVDASPVELQKPAYVQGFTTGFNVFWPTTNLQDPCVTCDSIAKGLGFSTTSGLSGNCVYFSNAAFQLSPLNDYILMRINDCDGRLLHQTRRRQSYETYFARLDLDASQHAWRANRYHDPFETNPFYGASFNLSTLRIRLFKPDGSLYETNRADHSFVLRVYTERTCV